MYLFFDTETTGLPKDHNAKVTDLDNWPRLVQLAWATTDYRGNIVGTGNHIIKPDGFTIPKEASNIHGISQEDAQKFGITIDEAIIRFNKDLHASEKMIAHNISFDYAIVSSEIIRNNLPSFMYKPKHCTMKTTVNLVKAKFPSGRGWYKWPKLEELYFKLFNEKIKDAHDAMVDMKALVRCFFELKRIGHITNF